MRVRSAESARIFPFPAAFSCPKAGFHFAGKCSKTCAAKVNRCGSGLPEGSRSATFRQRAARDGEIRSRRDRSALLGRRQVVRQGILIPPCGGSNPPAPANQCAYWRIFFFNGRKARHWRAFRASGVSTETGFAPSSSEIGRHSPGNH